MSSAMLQVLHASCAAVELFNSIEVVTADCEFLLVQRGFAKQGWLASSALDRVQA
jgi:hypothetical protein